MVADSGRVDVIDMSRTRTIKFIVMTSLAMVSVYRLPDILGPILALTSGNGLSLTAASPLLKSVESPALQQALKSLPTSQQTGTVAPAAALDIASLLGGKASIPSQPPPPPAPAKPDPEKVKELVNEAVALHSAGKIPEAIAAYRAILEGSPDDAGMRLNLAIALLQTGDAQAASLELNRAAELGRTPPQELLNAVEAQLAAAGS